jgi:hypothetical protein
MPVKNSHKNQCEIFIKKETVKIKVKEMTFRWMALTGF